MKILKLRLKNINSIQGLHSIDFAERPLSETGIFAITGETGAGKTTILDAITLALYNDVARGCNTTEMLSYGKTDALAEVEFSVNRKTYRASWAVKRARNKIDGRIQAPQWLLADITDSTKEITIADKIKDVKEKIVQITGGLDKDKFLQSVMLAQGNFAAFLKADPNARGELLEKITGQTDYSDLSIAAFERHKRAKTELENLKLSLGEDTLLSDDETKEIHEKSKLLWQEINSLKLENKQIETSINLHKQKSEAEAKANDAMQALSQLLAEKESKSFLAHKIRQHEKTLPWGEMLGQLDSFRQNIEQLHRQKETVSIELESSLIEQKGILSALKNAESAYSRKKQEITDLKPILEKAKELDSTINDAQKDINNLRNQHSDAFAKREKLQKELLANQTELSELNTSVAQLDKWLSENQNSKGITDLIAVLSERQTYCNELNSQRTNTAAQYKTIKNDLVETSVKIEQINKEISSENSLKSTLQEKLLLQKELLSQILGGQTLEKISSEKEVLISQGSIFSELRSLSENWQKDKNTIEQNIKQLETIKELQKETDTKLSFAESDEKACREKLVLLKEKRELELSIKKFEDDRKLLKEGQPCPLCGSKSHPWFSSTEARVDINASTKAIKETEERFVRIQNTIKSLLSNRPKQNEFERLDKHTDELRRSMDASSSLFRSKTEAEKIIAKIDETEQIAVQHTEYQQKYKELNTCIITAQKHEKEIKQTEFEIQEKEKKIVSLKHQHTIHGNKQAELQQKLKETEKNGIDLKQKIDSQIRTLNDKLLTFQLEVQNTAGIEDTRKALLKQQREFEKKQAEILDLKHKKASLLPLINKTEELISDISSSQLDPLNAKIQEEKKKLETIEKERATIFEGKDAPKLENDLNTQLEKAELNLKKTEKEHIRLHNQTDKLQTKLKDVNDQLETENRKAKKTEEAILKEAIGSFDNIGTIIASRMPINEYLEKKEEWEQICKNIDKSSERHSLLKNELENITQKTDQVPSIDELRAKESVNSGVIEKARNERTELEIKLKTNELAVQKQKALLIEQEKRNKELHRWETLNLLIGSAKGDKFRKFAQSVTLGFLTENANNHLERLSPRYSIAFNRNDAESLDLTITDNYQAENVRPMNTLSGGESFLVSLALALGLSDMASGNNPVESLFIDEGFGTLDPETLDIALSVLENLQASGKTIGIISHVEQLKDRISCQIRVIKTSEGASTIKISPSVSKRHD